MVHTTRIGKRVEYYTKDDCPHSFVYWKELQESGWCSTDDHYIVYGKVKEIVEIRGKGRRVRRRVKFPFGCRYTHGTSRYNFWESLENVGDGLLSKNWVDDAITRDPGIITVFAQMVTAGALPFNGRYVYTKEEYLVFYAMSEYFFNSNNQWRAVRTIFNHDRIRVMIQQKIDANLLKHGIDVDKVFELLKKAEDAAVTFTDKLGNGNPSAILAVAEKYAGLIGMNGKKQLGEGNHNGTPEQLPGAERTYDNILSNAEEAIVISEENK